MQEINGALACGIWLKHTLHSLAYTSLGLLRIGTGDNGSHTLSQLQGQLSYKRSGRKPKTQPSKAQPSMQAATDPKTALWPKTS